MSTILTGYYHDTICTYNGDKDILTLYQYYVSYCLSEITFPYMPDKFSIVLIILTFTICNYILIQPETHQISILETYIASLVFNTHSNTADFIGLLFTD